MKTRLFFLLAIMLMPVNIMAQPLPMGSSYDRQQLESMIAMPGEFTPLPTADSSFWQDNVPESMRQAYIDEGNALLTATWDSIPQQLFAEYREKGNRNNYEKRLFQRRSQLAVLVMAEIMEHSGRFMPQIANGMRTINNETWWGVPAHYPTNHPMRENQVVELFSSETACLMAWTLYMLRDEIEKTDKTLYQQTLDEINRRMLSPAASHAYDWKRRTSNWNPWICSNWLTCVLLCETNRTRQIDAIMQILVSMETFYNSYPEDGGCDEGPDYWDKAAGSFSECLMLIDKATDGKLTMSHDTKLANMASYIYRTYIGGGYYINFADAHPTVKPHTNILFNFAEYIGDDTMKRYAAYLGKRDSILVEPQKAFKASGNIPQLGRELMFLSRIQQYAAAAPQEPQQQNNWMPGHEVLINQADGLLLAAKGGNNGENHNHNDVGNFIIYGNSQPLIIDLGVGAYNDKTFSSHRYEIENTRSAYHNVPIINGEEQQNGSSFGSRNALFNTNGSTTTLTMDIAKAYPTEARVKKWIRTYQQSSSQGITITDDYRLRKFLMPSQIVLICHGKPTLATPGTIRLKSNSGNYELHYDPSELTPDIEKITTLDTSTKNSWKKASIYRILLTINSHAKKGMVSYSITGR